MIETDRLLPVAEALKLFGNNGTLVVKLGAHALKNIKKREPVFAIIDGIPVPFFISVLKTYGTDRAFILFDTINAKSQALELTCKILYVSLPKSKQKSARFKKPDELIGFSVSDDLSGATGYVDAFWDWHMNPCLSIQLSNSNESFLVPFQETFISNIDFKERHICLSLPEGFLLAQLKNGVATLILPVSSTSPPPPLPP